MLEWDQPSRLNTPNGDLLVNQAMTLFDGSTTGYFMVNAEQSTQAERAIRAVKDGVPQADGDILHRRYTNGTELPFVIQLWERIASSPGLDDGKPACGETLRLMLETLGYYLQAVLNGRGRWFWQPSGYPDERMLDECRWLVPVKRSLAGKLTTVTFTLDSPFPYIIDATQGSSAGSGGPIFVPAGTPTVIRNDGNHPFLPVIQALGPADAFTIENQSVIDGDGEPLRIVYDSDRPFPPGESGVLASSDYGEIDTFKETIYLNGNLANLKPGIDWGETDYFFLAPGANTIVADVDCEFLVNNAWVPM